jgi:glycosyltransferase involved in cell wall biosynthesis
VRRINHHASLCLWESANRHNEDRPPGFNDVMQHPLVSAVVLCYNQARFVTECLEGVKSQNYPNLELIINDDASRDDSASVIRQWLAQTDIPHRFLSQDSNRGLCRSLNDALSHARGKYVSAIAADDVWLPGKLLTQVETMERLPATIGVVYSDALQMDEDGNMLPQRFLAAHGHDGAMPRGDIQEELWKGNFIPAMTTLVRRDCYTQVGLFDESLFYEDWDMWLRVARYFQFAYSDHVSAKYRLVSASMLRSQFARINDSMCQVCVKHLKQGYLKGKSKRAAAWQLYNRAIYSFESASPGSRRRLGQALRYRPSPGIALRLLFASCGFGPGAFASMRSVLGKPRLKPG